MVMRIGYAVALFTCRACIMPLLQGRQGSTNQLRRPCVRAAFWDCISLLSRSLVELRSPWTGSFMRGDSNHVQ